jgi:hypothetical protein
MEIGEEICVEGCECFRGGIFVCVLDFLDRFNGDL